MNDVKSLWLVWQNSRTRSFYHVGTLYYYENKYEFIYTYNSEGPFKLKDALLNGYMLHPAFQNPEQIYKSDTLFSAFDRRLPSEIRANFENILSELHLTKHSLKMVILEETRGQLANDSYSFEKPLRVEKNGELHTTFFIHGMRHQNLPSNWTKILQTFKTVILKQEKDNVHDSNAVAIYTQTGLKLGYIPAFYAIGVSALIENGATPFVKVKYLDKDSTPNWWVKLSFISEIPDMNTEKLNKLSPFLENVI